MSQKELNYMEDAYNHELLIIKMLTLIIDNINDDNYIDLFTNQLKMHESILKKAKKTMEGTC